MFLAIIILFFLPFIDKPKNTSTRYRYTYQLFFWFFISDIVILCWLGGQAAIEPYIYLGQLATFFYFFFFLVILPLTTYIDDLAWVKFEDETERGVIEVAAAMSEEELLSEDVSLPKDNSK